MGSAICLLMLVAMLSMSQTSHSLLVNLDDIALSSLGGLQSGNANADIDFLLETFKSELPSRLKVQDFDRKLGYDCYLTGLGSGLYRNGDAILNVTNSAVVFSFGLATHRLEISCRWRTRKLFIKFSGRVSARTDKISMRAKFTMDLLPGAHPILNEFKVTEVQKIKTNVSGAGFMNWIGELYLNRKANGSKDKLIRQMEGTVSKKLQQKLNTIKLPTF